MLRKSGFALFAAAALVVVACSLWAFHDDSSAAPVILNYRQPIPAIARDGPPGPTPTPPPSSQLDVVVRVEMEVLELSLSATGTTQVTVKAEARTTLPGYFDDPKETHADVFATAHPTDVCKWKTVYADDRIKVTVSDSGGVFTRGVLIRIEESGWHFDVTCAPGHYQRVPQFGEESVGGWLGLIRPSSLNGVVIDTPDYSGSPSCIKRQGSVQNVHPVFGTAKVTVYAVEPGCIIPPPPTPTAPGTPGSGQNPAYEPGGT